MTVGGRSSPIHYFDQYTDTLTFGLGAALEIAGPWPQPAPIGTACAGTPPFTNCSTSVQMQVAQSFAATVWIIRSPGRVVRVTITPVAANPRVSLDHPPAGAPLTVSIPANARQASFAIHARQAGSFALVATADGYPASTGPLFVVSP